MILLYIIIGVAIGAVVLYLVMDKRLDALNIASGKKDIELAMRQEQLSAAQSRVQHLETVNKDTSSRAESLNARVETLSRELELLREQKAEDAKLMNEQFANMAQRILEGSAAKLKEQNTETMTGITQPLKEAIANMQKAINETQKESAAHSASFREQIQQMMLQTQQLGEKAEGLTNVLRRDNKVSGNMGEIILGDLLASQGLTEGIHY